MEANSATKFDVKVRFLHLVKREVGKVIADCKLPIGKCGHLLGEDSAHFTMVPSLEANGKRFQAWQEAVEREVVLRDLKISDMESQTTTMKFSFPSSHTSERLIEPDSGETVGVIVRTQEAIAGEVETSVSRLEPASSTESPNRQSAIGNLSSTLRVSVTIRNQTGFQSADAKSRDDALMRSLVSTHTILEVADGAFVSLLDPPDAYKAVASECINRGTYPVLVGDENSRNCVLSSPIILYDYPKIAEESAGDLFDGTEIDEILTLRIMTLTDDEKREVRNADDFARRLLERTENLPAEQLIMMHGVMKRSES
jgi:hydrogenase maturation protease